MVLLDLYCGAGGASVGYRRAGFDIVGVDIENQPNYPFRFVRMDAIEFLRETTLSGEIKKFAAIHASPPCQAYSRLRHITKREYPDLLANMREMLE